MQGADSGEIGLDCFGLHTSTEVCDPRHDGALRGWKDGTIGVVEAMQLDKIDELPLSGRVGAASACGETVPKVKSDGLGPLGLLLVPPIGRIG